MEPTAFSPVDAYDGPGMERILEADIKAGLSARLRATIVDGFQEMVDAGEAICGGQRISGFMERHTYGEWLLRLSASRGMRWRTRPVPAGDRDHVLFFLALGFGNGSALPQPSGAWEIWVNDHHAVTVRVVNHDQLWRRGDCSLAFCANRIEAAPLFGSLCLSSIITQESLAAFGPAFLRVPASWVPAGAPAEILVRPVSTVPSERWIQLEHCPAVLRHADIYRLADLHEAPPRLRDWNLYFGDIHTHSGQVLDQDDYQAGCGMGSRRDNYEYARGPGGLDFYALTDHEYQMSPDTIPDYLTLADEFEQAGRFVCLPAFEFTSLVYGHRNAYFRGSGGTVINANRDWGHPTMDPERSVTPRELWDGLAATGVPFLTIPHHPSSASHPCNIAIFDERYDRLMEVYSVWGSSEFYGDVPRGVSDRYRTLDIRDALGRGRHFGMAAGADGHDGHPGNAQSPLVKHHHQFHFCGSGRTVVLAEDLTREHVFDAMFDRRCYATTGPPILLDVRLDGAVMGQRLSRKAKSKRPQLSVLCRGTNGIDHVRIVRNGRVVHTHPVHGEYTVNLEWEDSEPPASPATSYYVRVVQRDHESAWSSPIRLED